MKTGYFLESSLVNLNIIDCEIERIILKINAVKKPSTLKPTRKWSQINMIIALIANRNNPSVKMVIGKVKNTKIGFTIAFKIARTIATIIDDFMFSTKTPFI